MQRHGASSSRAARRASGAGARVAARRAMRMASGQRPTSQSAALPGLAAFPPKAKRVHLSAPGGRAAADGTVRLQAGHEGLFDKDLPDSIRQGQRLTTMTSGQSRFPIAPSIFQVRAARASPARGFPSCCPTPRRWWTTSRSSESMHTEAINHEPAITFIQTGFMIAGRPCIGSWLSYGLGSMNQDLPTFVVLQRKPLRIPRRTCRRSRRGCGARDFCPASTPAWACGAPAIRCCIINNPDGVPRRRAPAHAGRSGRDESDRRTRSSAIRRRRTRIAQYEMAFRMQASVPELTDLSKEPESTYKLYGEDARKAGHVRATRCLMARRLVERGVRFVQVYHRGWDVHGNLPEVLPSQCKDVDQAC